MATSEAQKRASIKYKKEKQKRIPIDVKPEEKERYEAAAKASGKSLRAFILESIELNILLEEKLDEVGEYHKKKLLEFVEIFNENLRR